MANSVYLICGEDEYMVSEKSREILDSHIPAAEREFGLEVIDGNVDTVDTAMVAIHSCLEAVQTVGLFSSNKTVWFRDVAFLTGNRTGKTETVKTGVAEFGELIKKGIPDGVVLVITSPKVDKRSAFYKACKATATIEEFAVSTKGWENEKQAEERVRQMLGKAGLKMPKAVMSAFLQKVGTETRQIVNEIDKLAVFLGDRKDVTVNDVEVVTSSSRGAIAWDLADAVGSRDLPQSLRVLRQLMFHGKGESPIGLIMALEGRFRDLLVYREGIDKGWLTVGSGQYGKAKWGNVPPEVDAAFSDKYPKDPRSTHPFRMGVLASQAKKFSMMELKRAQTAVVKAHVQLVSSAVPQSLTMELLLTRILARPAGAAKKQ